MLKKLQRIRDPLHNLIEFGADDFEQELWRVVQTPAFQRLRRVKQLGFSEFTYPGATHTRFSHCIGVYHIAKGLLQIIESKSDRHNEYDKKMALAAALVHDVGHGPFSHAFEDVGKKLDLTMAKHVEVGDLLIRRGEIGDILDRAVGSGFSAKVANLIKAEKPSSVYGAVVSSQFDADRLDYMQRDRLMTGTQLGGIDFAWLMASLDIGDAPWGDDEGKLGELPTFVLGPKAIHATEAYVLSLFQLYPTVYYHKATRGLEKMFSALLLRLFYLANNGDVKRLNLPTAHPLVRFARKPADMTHVLALDDTVIMGALPLLAEGRDPLISSFAARILQRKIYKCIDILVEVKKTASSGKRVVLALNDLRSIFEEKYSQNSSSGIPKVLIDEGERHPYKKRRLDDMSPLNQILVRSASDEIEDIVSQSTVISGIKPFSFFRAYVDENDHESKALIVSAIKGVAHGKRKKK